MDFRTIIDRGDRLREVFPEIQALFPTQSLLLRAMTLVLTPLEGDEEASVRADALRKLWVSVNRTPTSDERRHEAARKRAARTKYLQTAEYNRTNGLWCYRGKLSGDQRDAMWIYIHKLRSLEYRVPFESARVSPATPPRAPATGITTGGVNSLLWI
ncbi:hypothetical protein P3T76_000525 [Phytophthora citrophthora]|uniref:Uncharacterized protein n=1 Tax=Phytophthora citrophthora TaxID=4793 RepID=A0AAD9H081_9STRA|nr:hypothetical protein P3T76_000525 [Phytophthora citrophthora]